jgi:hypothetical protein
MLSLVQIKCARSSKKIPYVVMILKNKHGGYGQCLFLLAETNEYLPTFQQWMNNQMSNSGSIESLVSNFISSIRVGYKSVIKQKCLYEN